MYSAPEMIAASNEIKAPIDSDCKIVLKKIVTRDAQSLLFLFTGNFEST